MSSLLVAIHIEFFVDKSISLILIAKQVCPMRGAVNYHEMLVNDGFFKPRCALGTTFFLI